MKSIDLSQTSFYWEYMGTGIFRGIATIILFTLGMSAEAQVIKPTASHFSQIGKSASFTWVPASYQDATHANSFFYDIFYYIPKKLNQKQAALSPALIFDHGGGESTLTREGSIAAVKLYINDIMKLADDLGIVVVLPSANGLNWGGHTVGMQRELLKLMRAELNVDPDRIGLSGHSMGGMGITRSYQWLADDFAFFLPLAAGMDLSSYTNPDDAEYQLNKVFNVPYIHLQGLQDSFQIFVTECKDQLARTLSLESKYGVKSKLNLYFYNTTHNYQFPVFEQFLSNALKTGRDLYQKELWGSLLTVDTFRVENNIPFHWGSVPRYFWVEAINSVVSAYERINFHAKVVDNVVSIDIKTGTVTTPVNTHELRIYFSSKLEDLTKPVSIYINGKLVGTRDPSTSTLQTRTMDASDAGYLFDDYLDVKIPLSSTSELK